MPSWIERMAWRVRCPTCDAGLAEPCRAVQGSMKPLDFNHPSRNQRFHVEQQRRRASRRQEPPPGRPSG